MALWDILKCLKKFCVTCAKLLQGLQKMTCIFRGRRGTLDVSCCVFCESHCQGCIKAGANVQLAWQAWGTVRVSFCVASAAFGEGHVCVERFFAWQAGYLRHSSLYK